MKISVKDQKTIKWIFFVFLLWRGSLCLLALLAKKWLPLNEGYLGESVWANFDGVHYLSIARHGYFQFQQAFFPLYPLLIRWLSHNFLANYLFSGLLISHLSLLTALFLFFKLVRLDFSGKISRRATIFLLLFPTSFYFASVYTESLFFALVLGSFYASRKRAWLLAGVLGGLASATRVVGVFLFPALLVEWFQQETKNKKEKIKNFLPLILILTGLFGYMWYLREEIGDPLFFVHVQPLFGAERTGGKVILLYQVFWRYLRMLATVEKMTSTYFVVVLEFLSGLLFLFLSILAYFRLRLSYFIFMILAYLLPTLTGTFSSMPRYVLVLFPGFILLSFLAERHRWLKIGYPLLAGALLMMSVFLFTRGFWLA